MCAVAAVSALFAVMFGVEQEQRTAIVVPTADVAGATISRARPLGGSYEEPAPPKLIETIWAWSSSISVRPDEPTLHEILVAADALVRAGVIEPPQPSMREILLAADALNKAGALPEREPSPGEVLRAVSMLIDAGALDPATGAPPAARIEAPAPIVAPPPPRPTSTPVPAPASDGGWYDVAFAGRIMALVNVERTSRGLAPVEYEPLLTDAAESYAQVLTVNDWFSHVGPDGSTIVDRITATGFRFDTQLGEVLAWGEDWSPEGIVQAWLASPSHREQLLEPIYRRAGVGCYFRIENGSTAVRCAMEFAG
jgi:uncharacterized protein YkwD